MAKLKFTRRPTPVLAEHRPLYKMAQALLIIDICGRGQRCSLIKLHLINWALKSPSRIDSLQRASRTKNLALPIWGFDPALAIALQLAIEEGMLAIEGNGLSTTEKGSDFLKEILKDKDSLKSERDSLSSIGKGLTEQMVSTAAKGWE